MEAPEEPLTEELIESKILEARSAAADKLLYYHCKERALEDLQQVLRDKDMPMEDSLKLVRSLAKKQCKIVNKMRRLNAYHTAHQV